MPSSGLINIKVINRAVESFVVPLLGIHGVHHWVRVLENGMKLAERNDADSDVVETFAFLHDIGRRDDGLDPEHGERSADFVLSIRDEIPLSDEQFEILVEAIRFHNKIRFSDNLTIQTCWDADRLDIGRSGKFPKKHYLGTAFAKNKEVIDWAYKRSVEEC